MKSRCLCILLVLALCLCPLGAWADPLHLETQGKGGWLDDGITAPARQTRAARLAGLPAAYSLVEQGLTTPVKDQGDNGLCWAFAAIGAAESSLLAAGGDSADLSELQLAYFFYHLPDDVQGLFTGHANTMQNGKSFLDGGNANMAAVAMASWLGVVPEDLVPYEKTNRAEQNGLSDEFAFRVNSAVLKNTRYIPVTDLTGLKTAIMNSGGLCFSYAHDDGAYNRQTAAYYKPGTGGFGHAAVLVGWDDNYSRENFLSDQQPMSNGAFLVRNSWGRAWGQNGYFWISYEDADLQDIKNSALAFEFAPADEYDYNYQYDGTGSRAGRNMNTNALRAANVFTSQRAETLKAVSFSLFENADVAYTVSVYLNPSDPQHPDSGTLAAQVSGATGYAGLYTVALDAPVTLGQGTVFAIVVELSGETPLILPADEDNEDLAWVHFTAQSSAGQSFVSTDGLSWTDVGAAQDGYNLRIKGYTTENNDRGRITVASFENAVSSSGQLACRALLQGVTGAPVWSIVKGEATVDQTGVVTALGPGEVTVRAAVGDVYGEKTITVNSGKGTGTALDPHRIYTASDLLNVRNDRAAAYKLMNDITLSGSSRPLGDSAETRFSGIFDGQGYAIRNLNLTANGLGGLFGYLYKAEIRDLSLPGGSATVLGHSEAGENLYIGALAGYAFESTIVRCQSDLAVHAEGGAGDWLFAGGLVGRTQGGAMTDCGFSGPIEIKGSAPVAHSGLVAQADDTVFENCFISTGALADKVDSVSVLNCYDTQGAHGAAALNSAAFASGEAALLLQNGRSTPVWGQQIKSQAVPHLGAEAVAQFRAVHYLQAAYADEYEQKTDDPVFLNAARALLQGRRSFNGFVLANSEQDGQTLTYVYHRRVYEVQFDGGSISVPSARVRHGARVNSPYVEREGYTLGGWYTEDGTLYDFSLPVTQALALSARWSPIPGAETDAPLPPAGPTPAPDKPASGDGKTGPGCPLWWLLLLLICLVLLILLFKNKKRSARR